MRWFLVYAVIDGARLDFACVNAWTRTEAFLSAVGHFPDLENVRIMWDTDEITVTPEIE